MFRNQRGRFTRKLDAMPSIGCGIALLVLHPFTQFLRTKLGPSTVLQPRVVDAEARLPERAAEWEEVVR